MNYVMIKKLMKKFICTFCLCFSFISMLGQSQSESSKALDKVNDYVMEVLGAFFMNPDNSHNNKVVYEKIKDVDDFYSEELENKYKSPYYESYTVREYYDKIERMKNITGVMRDFLNPLAGYVGGSIDGPSFDIILKPIFDQFDWSCKKLSVNCSDIIFYEYTYKNFKMLLAYNTRSEASRSQKEQGIYNDNEVKCFAYNKAFRRVDWFAKLVVRGGKYRIVEFKDDTNNVYNNLLKATSKRLD